MSRTWMYDSSNYFVDAFVDISCVEDCGLSTNLRLMVSFMWNTAIAWSSLLKIFE